jgi:hypothetical protein
MIVDGLPLSEQLAVVKQGYKDLMESHENLIKVLKNHYIVQEDKEYLVQLGDRVEKVDKLIVHKVEDLQFPLHFYKVVDGKLVVDKKKKGAL